MSSGVSLTAFLREGVGPTTAELDEAPARPPARLQVADPARGREAASVVDASSVASFAFGSLRAAPWAPLARRPPAPWSGGWRRRRRRGRPPGSLAPRAARARRWWCRP